MNDRLKVFVIIAVLGFLAGIIAYTVYQYVLPWLEDNLHALSGAGPFLISGFIGALLTVLLVAVWAMLTGRRNQ